MNIQIFGIYKSFNTKKAQRYFSERKIKFQFIDLKEKAMSRGEWNSVAAALGGYKNMLDENARDRELLTLIKYLTDDDAEQKVFENQAILKMPIVRDGRRATIGYAPDVWNTWN